MNVPTVGLIPGLMSPPYALSGGGDIGISAWLCSESKLCLGTCAAEEDGEGTSGGGVSAGGPVYAYCSCMCGEDVARRMLIAGVERVDFAV